MKLKIFLLSGLPLLVMGLALLADRASAEPGDDPHQTVAKKAYSKHDALRETYAFNRETLVGAYRQHGKKNPKWNKDAEALLELYAAYFTYNNSHNAVYCDQPLAEVKEKFGDPLPRVAALARAKCDDPLVLYLMGAAYESTRKFGQSEKCLAQAHEGFKQSSYPDLRKLNSYNRAFQRLRRVKSIEDIRKRIVIYIDEAVPLIPKVMLEQGEVAPLFVRGDLADQMSNLLKSMTRFSTKAEKIKIYERALQSVEQAGNGDVWLYYAVKGLLLADLAWVHRGGDWANNVKPEQWRAFEEHLVQARTCFEVAWGVEKNSYIASQMISIAMAGHAAPGQDHWFWFQRGKDEMFDDTELWDRVLNATLPRWGGSRDEMLKVALEAVNTGRFDTEVPFYGVNIIKRIEKETNDDAIWSHPKALEAMERMTRGFESSERSKTAPPGLYQLMRAAYMWKGRDLKRTRQALDDVGPITDEVMGQAKDVFRRVGVEAYEAIGLTYLHTSDHADQVAKTLKLLEAGTSQQAKAHIEQLLAKGDSIHPSGRAYLQSKLSMLSFFDQFESGQWVSLNRPEHLKHSWDQAQGKWRLDNKGQLIGEAGQDGLALIFKHWTQGPWEMSCDVQIIAQAARGWATIGLVTRHKTRSSMRGGAWIYPRTKSMATYMEKHTDNIYNNWEFIKTVKAIKPGKDNITIRHDANGQVTVSVNGQRVKTYEKQGVDQPRRFGLSSLGAVFDSAMATPGQLAKVKVRFSDVKVRRIKDDP